MVKSDWIEAKGQGRLEAKRRDEHGGKMVLGGLHSVAR